MVRLIPLLKRVFFCSKIQRKAPSCISPAARSSAPHVTSRRGDPCGRPLRRTPCNPFVGADASVRPPGLYRISNNVSLRSQCAHWLWQSASPVPLAPLPKGGWHGKAVTGGFRSPRTSCTLRRGRRPRRPVYRTSCCAFVGADAHIGPHAGTSCNPSVGADAHIGPLTAPLVTLRRAGCPHPATHRTPCKNPVIAKPVRTLAVAIRVPRPLGPLA